MTGEGTIPIQALGSYPGVVAHGSATGLQKPAHDRKARPRRGIQQRYPLSDLVRVQPLRVDAVQPHGVSAPLEGIDLGIAVSHIEDPQGAVHNVEVKVPAQPLPQFHGVLVEPGVGFLLWTSGTTRNTWAVINLSGLVLLRPTGLVLRRR